MAGSQSSIIAWVGGKRLLKKRIISMIPKHDKYVEVFGGAGWVLFGKSQEGKDWKSTKPSEYLEIYNDINGNLVNFRKYIKHHPNAFVSELESLIASKEIFEAYKNRTPFTELERAVNFYYKLALSFGSMSRDFAIRGRRNLLPLTNINKVIKASERLFKVAIENRSYEKIIKLHDGERTFFYLDPPYYEYEKYYERDGLINFSEHNMLSQQLKTIKGKFLLSYNDHPKIRELYKDFSIIEVKTTYQLSGKKKNKTELIIKNY